MGGGCPQPISWGTKDKEQGGAHGPARGTPRGAKDLGSPPPECPRRAPPQLLTLTSPCLASGTVGKAVQMGILSVTASPPVPAQMSHLVPHPPPWASPRRPRSPRALRTPDLGGATRTLPALPGSPRLLCLGLARLGPQSPGLHRVSPRGSQGTMASLCSGGLGGRRPLQLARPSGLSAGQLRGAGPRGHI